jgi:hypothetical protein
MNYSPSRPEQQGEFLQMITLQDAMTHVLLAFNLDLSAQNGRRVRAAVMEAYRSFPDEHAWKHYERTATITTTPMQITGKVTYDAPSRLVTLSGATWPESLLGMKIEFANQVAEIAERISATVLRLRQQSAHTTSQPAQIDYVLFRDKYPLPLDYRKGGNLYSFDSWSPPVFVTPEKGQAYLQSYLHFARSPQDVPGYYTFSTLSESMGQRCIQLIPPPSGKRSYSFAYTSSPRPFTLFPGTEYSIGTITSSGTTVTGAGGAAFTAAMIGAVLRRPMDITKIPTGLNGGASLGADGPDENDFPYAEQRMIMDVPSVTTLTLDEPFSSDIAASSKYSIGSPVDLAGGTIETAFLVLCEAVFARLVMRDDADDRHKRYVDALLRAKAADTPRRTLTKSYLPPATSLAEINRRGGV